MEEIIKPLRREIKRGNLEDFLLSVLEKNPPANLILEIFSFLQKENQLPLPSSLFSLILDYLKEKKDYPSALTILKMQSQYLPKDFNLRKEAINLLKVAYPIPEIEDYISQSHLDGDEDIKEGIETVENFARFTVGNFIFSNKEGLGRIKGYDFLLEQVLVKFAQEEKKIPIAYLFKNFTPLPFEHYLVQKETNPEELKRLSETDPGALFLLLLKSFKKLRLSEIKSHLSGIVTDWENFWKKVKTEINAHPQIQSKQEKERVYEWTDQLQAKEEKKEEKVIFSLGEIPEREEEMIKMIENLTHPLRKEFLQKIKEERENWSEIFFKIFFATREEKLFNLLAQNMEESDLETILYEVFTSYHFYPFHFYWLVKNYKGRFITKALFLRLYELLGNKKYKEFWRYHKRLLKDKEFVKEAIREMNEEERRRILSSLPFLPSLLDYEKGEMERTIKELSGLKEEKDVIYNTEEGIKRMEEELKRLLQVELKKNAEALARARSYGDLSENYEYKIAKEERNRLMNRIKKLEEDLAKAVPITFPKGDLTEVEIGSRVRIRNLLTNEIKEWTILGPWDIDLEKNIISYQSPFGRSLLGKRTGERINWEGEDYEIIAVEGLKTDGENN
ncbi:MAG: GreA/GreB family elongation factor [candidate division WOR-3 bacterium]